MVTFHTHLTVRPIPLFISFYDRAPFPNPRAPNSESKVSINSMAVLSLRRRVLQHRAHERITAFKPFQIKVFQVMRKKLITKLKQFSKWQLRLHFFTKKCFCLLSLVCCALAVWETATPPTRVTILIYNVMLFLMEAVQFNKHSINRQIRGSFLVAFFYSFFFKRLLGHQVKVSYEAHLV